MYRLRRAQTSVFLPKTIRFSPLTLSIRITIIFIVIHDIISFQDNPQTISINISIKKKRTDFSTLDTYICVQYILLPILL